LKHLILNHVYMETELTVYKCVTFNKDYD